MKINVLFGSSMEYQQHVGCIIASILANSKHPEDEYHFYIMSSNFLTKTKNYFEQLKNIRPCEITFFKINDRDFDGMVHDWLGVPTYYRLKIFDLLTTEDKILYLDSDVIVRDDIRNLYSTDITDYYCAGIEDKMNINMRPRVQMTEADTFINAGVLLLNLAKCREDKIHKKMFAELKKSTYWNDQDAINFCMKGHIKLVDLKWNVMFPYPNTYKDQKHYQEVAQNPSILHYTLTNKPWVPGSNPYMKLDYFKYLKLTPWFNDFFPEFVLQENLNVINFLNNQIQQQQAQQQQPPQ